MQEATAEALKALLAGASANDLEGDTLDFKEPTADVKVTFKIVSDAAVCFVNARGGDIVLGVDDKGRGGKALVGVNSKITVDNLRRAIFDRTRPQLTCFVEEHEMGGQRIIIVSVPQGVGPHANSSGTATRRMGKDCLPFTPEQQREVLISRGQIDFSAEATAATLTDLSAVEFERMRRLLIRAGKTDLAGLADEGLLRDLRLATADGRLTNAALLLLGHEEAIAQYLPAYGYSYQFRPSGGSEATARLRARRPILSAVDELISGISARIQVHPLNLAGGVQLRLSDYPLDAVRELVVNGLIHRSYEADGTVDVEHTPEQLVIASPGGLVAGVTPDNILTYPSTPRNRLLTETVAALQLAERTGQGVDRVYREMLRSGKEPPQFDDVGTLVRAMLPGGVGNDSFVRFVNVLPDDLAGDVDVLLVFAWLRTQRSVDALQLAGLIQRSVIEAQRVLGRLAEASFLEASRRTATRPQPTYRLRSETIAAMSRAVAYGRRGVDDIDQKVIEHVREYDFVTNRTIQRLFDISVYAARNMLAEMRGRGLLEKIGEARGGPGVRYGPGPEFPK